MKSISTSDFFELPEESVNFPIRSTPERVTLSG